MKPLNEYQTLETDALSFRVGKNALHPLTVIIAAEDARDLERRLALCRDALRMAHRNCGDRETEPLDEHAGDQRDTGERIRLALEATEAKR